MGILEKAVSILACTLYGLPLKDCELRLKWRTVHNESIHEGVEFLPVLVFSAFDVDLVCHIVFVCVFLDGLLIRQERASKASPT